MDISGIKSVQQQSQVSCCTGGTLNSNTGFGLRKRNFQPCHFFNKETFIAIPRQKSYVIPVGAKHTYDVNIRIENLRDVTRSSQFCPLWSAIMHKKLLFCTNSQITCIQQWCSSQNAFSAIIPCLYTAWSEVKSKPMLC